MFYRRENENAVDWVYSECVRVCVCVDKMM